MKITDEYLDKMFKELFYDLGECNFNVLTSEAWDKFINYNESFNEKQLECFRYFIENLLEHAAKN